MTPRVPTVFLGSGAFAVPILHAVARHPAVELRAVVTAPARPAGRRRVMTPSPVAVAASDHAVPVLTPERLRAPEAVEAVARLAPGLLVLADYGRIVPRALLDLPVHGALNLHPSLLPRHRGASPIPATIAAGDGETGVTLIRMDEGIDTGPIVAQRRVTLDGTERAPQLEDRLADLAAELLDGSLAGWLRGDVPARPQPAKGATLTRPLHREDGRLDPTRPAAALERQVRALEPWPGTWLDAGGERLAVLHAEASPSAPGDDPGRLVAVGDGLALATVDGRLLLLDVRPAGGVAMTAAELRRGRPHLAGAVVASPAAPEGQDG